MVWGLASLAFLLGGVAVWYYAFALPKHHHTVHSMAANPYNKHLIDSAAQFLQHGDVVVRTGNDMTSEMFRQANQTDKTYSHCGIVMIEEGKPYVYHCIGGEDNPNEVLRRDSLSFWASPRNNYGFGIVRYRFTPTQLDSFCAIAKHYYQQKKKFDLDFDLQSDDKLYCAELLYIAINRSMGKPVIQTTQAMGHDYAAIDNITHNAYCQMICEVRYK
ncbi:hypothetical protein CAP35_02330 [Chitinophagaceae bacterium IBVUCB1]|nr:hypothetical protein CAP35_02330 [Chitinophagaceae bacterium IBVUCB1]